MRGLSDNFSLAMQLSLGVAVLTAVVAGVVAAVRFRDRRPVLAASARVATAGAALIAFVATSVRGDRLVFERGGDLVLQPGRAGLGDFDQLLANPTSLAAVLLVANVLLYVAVAFAGVLGWPHRHRLVLPACLGLSLTVETVQYLALGRVASTDDVLLNMLGATIGYGLGRAALRAGLSSAKSRRQAPDHAPAG